jgi:hypothetical protein
MFRSNVSPTCSQSKKQSNKPARSTASYLLQARFLLGLFFEPEDGGDIFLWEVGWFFQRTTWHIPEDKTLHNHRCENLKFFTESTFVSLHDAITNEIIRVGWWDEWRILTDMKRSVSGIIEAFVWITWRKPRKLSQDNRNPGRDSNRAATESKSRALLLDQPLGSASLHN